MDNNIVLERDAMPANPDVSRLEGENTDKTKDCVLFGMRSVKSRVDEMVQENVPLEGMDTEKMTDAEKKDFITAGRCKSNSAYVLETMTRYYPDSFQDGFIITGVNTSGFKDAPGNSEHSYFVVRSKDGKYFAGSPANTVGGSDDNFDALIEGDNLSDVLVRINERSGGNWPTSDQVMHGLEENPPEIKSDGTSSHPSVEFTNIAYSYPEYYSRREKYDFTNKLNPDFSGFVTEP